MSEVIEIVTPATLKPKITPCRASTRFPDSDAPGREQKNGGERQRRRLEGPADQRARLLERPLGQTHLEMGKARDRRVAPLHLRRDRVDDGERDRRHGEERRRPEHLVRHEPGEGHVAEKRREREHRRRRPAEDAREAAELSARIHIRAKAGGFRLRIGLRGAAQRCDEKGRKRERRDPLDGDRIGDRRTDAFRRRIEYRRDANGRDRGGREAQQGRRPLFGRRDEPQARSARSENGVHDGSRREHPGRREQKRLEKA